MSRIAAALESLAVGSDSQDFIPATARDELIQAIPQLLSETHHALPDKADFASEALESKQVQQILSRSLRVDSADRFLAELRGAILGEQILLAARDHAVERLCLLIPQMVSTLQGTAVKESVPLPRVAPDSNTTSGAAIEAIFTSLAQHPEIARDPAAMRQARVWVRRRLQAIQPAKAPTPPSVTQARIVRANLVEGEQGWFRVTRILNGEGGCYADPIMFCYPRDVKFEEGVSKAWQAAQAFVKEATHRKLFFDHISSAEINRRLQTMEVWWQVEIGQRRTALRDESAGAAMAVAFVSALTDLPYQAETLLTATTDGSGTFGEVGFVYEKLQAAIQQRDSQGVYHIQRVLVHPSQENLPPDGFVQKVTNIAEALPFTSRVSAPLGQDEQADRTAMLQRVKDIYKELRQNRALLNPSLLPLNLTKRPDSVVRPGEWKLRRAGQPDTDIPPGTTAYEIFEQLRGELLVLGNKGSGKSTFLLNIAERLLHEAERDQTRPIPVIFDLSAWGKECTHLDKWLIDQFQSSGGYKIPRRIATQWVQSNRILVLLDGLDEVKESHRAACLKAINAYNREDDSRMTRRGARHASTGAVSIYRPLVISCRTDDYQSMQDQKLSKLHLNNAVEILPLTREQVEESLSLEGDRLRGLRAFLADNPSYYNTVFMTPLAVSVGIITFADRSADELGQGIPDEERERWLWDAYIDEMLVRKAGQNPSYAEEEAIHWLEWLAGYLDRKGPNQYRMDMLQPDDLPYPHQTALVRHLFALFASIVAGALLHLTFVHHEFLAAPLTIPWFFVGASREIHFDHIRRYYSLRTLRLRWRSVEQIILRGTAIGAVGGACIGAIIATLLWPGSSALYGSGSGALSGAILASIISSIQAVAMKEDIKEAYKTDALPKGEQPNIGIRHSLGTIYRGDIQGTFLSRLYIAAFAMVLFLIYKTIFDTGMAFLLRSADHKHENAVWLCCYMVWIAGLPVGFGVTYGPRMGAALGLALAEIGLSIYFALVAPTVSTSDYKTPGYILGLLGLLLFSLFVGYRGGIRTVFQHYLLRWFLARDGLLPYRCVPFLDWAAERILVTREKGGWRFIHEALQKRLAQRYAVRNSAGSQPPEIGFTQVLR